MALLNRLTIQKKAWFFHQCAALLNSGLTVQQSLNLASRECNPSFQRYMHRVSAAVEEGQDLASALAIDSRYFDRWTISLIRLAEYSDSLAQACAQLASAAEAQARRERLYRAVRFSAIATIWGILIVIAVIFNHSPRGFIKPEFWIRSVAIALLLLGISVLVTRYSSKSWQQLLMKLPVVGKMVQARSLLYLAQLQLPLGCGVPILTALELVRDHIPDPVMRSNLTSAARKIRIGQSLSTGLEGHLPPIAMQMIRTGEETGNLDTALNSLGAYYEGELERRLGLLQTTLRSLSVMAIAVLVAAVGIRGMMLLLNSLPE